MGRERGMKERERDRERGTVSMEGREGRKKGGEREEVLLIWRGEREGGKEERGGKYGERGGKYGEGGGRYGEGGIKQRCYKHKIEHCL